MAFVKGQSAYNILIVMYVYGKVEIVGKRKYFSFIGVGRYVCV